MTHQTRDQDEVYIQAGESETGSAHFSVDRVAEAFGIERERVVRAVKGEFGLGADGLVDGTMAQHLAEVLLADAPLDKRNAALMKLGAFTPRGDAMEGLGDGPPDEESDRQAASADLPDHRFKVAMI